MIVHLTGGIRAVDEDRPYFKKIVEVMHRNGIEIASNWIEVAGHSALVKGQKNDEADWHEYAKQNELGLKRADVVIIETTSYRLFHGYEAATALSLGKPVLMISRKSFREYAISGVQDPLLAMEVYTNEDNLEDIVTEFLKATKLKAEKVTIDIAQDRKLHDFIDKKTAMSDQTKEKVLLELAQKGMAVELLNS